MRSFIWVLEEVVLAVHDEQLAQHGGLSGVRDSGAVASALARPRNLNTYDDCEDIGRHAAAYSYGIARNHGFSDGNKRTTLVTADLFLMLNGFELDSTPADNVLTMLGVADGTISEEELCAWFQQHIRNFNNKS